MESLPSRLQDLSLSETDDEQHQDIRDIPASSLLQPVPSLCHFCRDNIFSHLFSKVSRLWARDSSPCPPPHNYERRAQDICRDGQNGCPWCTNFVHCLLRTVEFDWFGSGIFLPQLDRGDNVLLEVLLSETATKVDVSIDFEKLSQNMELHFRVGFDILQRQDEDSDEERELLPTKGRAHWLYRLNTTGLDTAGCPISPKMHGDFDMASEEAFTGIRAFLSKCPHAHEGSCSDKSNLQRGLDETENDFKTHELPSRVVNIAVDPPRIVVYPQDATHEQYAALSYVWGTSNTYQLKSSTSQAMATSLEKERLPRAILEAMLVAHKLDIRFLWIDALCIVQDDEIDMQCELAKMHAIYRNAELTIVAAASGSVQDSFLVKSVHRESHSVSCMPALTVSIAPPESDSNMDNHDSTRIDLILTEGQPLYYSFRDPLNSRAWTLQEHIMSRHLVVFAHDGIEMVCKHLLRDRHSSTSPVSSPPQELQPISQQQHPLAIQSRLISVDFDNQPPSAAWYTIVEAYTARKLTDPDDKLIAISALAREMSCSFPAGRYLAGLWEQTLVSDLQWSTRGSWVSPGHYRAPSWSWAARDGAVRWQHRYGGDVYRNCRVSGCSVGLRDERNPLGSVAGGQSLLVLRGVARAATLTWGLAGFVPYFTGVSEQLDVVRRGRVEMDHTEDWYSREQRRKFMDAMQPQLDRMIAQGSSPRWDLLKKLSAEMKLRQPEDDDGGATFQLQDPDSSTDMPEAEEPLQDGVTSKPPEFFLIGMHTYNDNFLGTGPHVRGLVLLPTDDGKYVRVGCFSHLDPGVLDDCPEQCFVLV